MNLPGYVNKMSEVKEYEGTPSYSFFSFEKGTKEKSVQVHFLYVLGNHLGNVLATVSDRKIPHNNNGIIDYYTADIVSSCDMYPGGFSLPDRSFNLGSYRFGHNGQLKDDEISGTGNMYIAEYWEYDSRLIRRWNIDPVLKPWESPYACFSNNPIWLEDIHGADSSKATLYG